LSKWVQRRSVLKHFSRRVNIEPIGKCSSAFISEPTNMIKDELYMNVHWMVVYTFEVFCSDMKFKMAVTAGVRLTLHPYAKTMSCSGSHLGIPINIKNKQVYKGLSND
jgi:hypothetical protein